MTDFNEVIIIQIPREQNIEAYTLAELASFEEPTDQRIDVQYSPSHKGEEMNPIDIRFMDDVNREIHGRWDSSNLPRRSKEAKSKGHRFILIHGILYRRGFSLPYLRCLDKLEAKYVIKEVHEGICDNHSWARSLVHKLVRAGYYWPTMQKDAVSYTRAYDKCQRFGNLTHSPQRYSSQWWPLAFRLMGIGYHGTFSSRTKTTEISGNRDRLLHQMGGSRITRDDYWEEREGICMEGNNMQIWNP